MRAVCLGLSLIVGFGASAAAQDDMELQRCIWRCLAEFGPNTNPAYHQCVADVCTPESAPADWGFVDALIQRTLGPFTLENGSYFFPDNADPALATQALAVLYTANPEANSFGVSFGYYRNGPQGFEFVGQVERPFGEKPRDVVFAHGRIEITTTVPGPNDPRCCPSQSARWVIDTANLRAVRVQ
jgi:hypothetical protein